MARDCRCDITVAGCRVDTVLPAVLRGGNGWTGLCVRGVEVILENDECTPLERRIGTAVCVEVVDVDATDGLGDTVRSGIEGGNFGVTVRLEEADANEGFGETLLLSRCLSLSTSATYSECSRSTVRRSCTRRSSSSSRS